MFISILYSLNQFFPTSVLVLFQLLTQSPDQVLPAGSRPKPGRIPYLLQGCALPCLHSPAYVSVSKVQFMASVVYGSSSFGSRKSPKAYRVVPDFLHLSAPQTAPDGPNKQSALKTFVPI